MHVGQVWRLRAEKASPDGACVEDERIRLTSGEFAVAAVERLSGGLASLGVGTGDVVATMLPNCVEMVLTLFAAWRMGVAVTPVNPALTTGEAGYQLADLGAKVVIAGTPSRPGSCLEQVFVSSRSNCTVGRLGGPAPPLRAEAGDLALLVYTEPHDRAAEGSHARPRRTGCDDRSACHRARNRGGDARAARTAAVPRERDHGQRCVSACRWRFSTVIQSRFDAKTFWQQVETHRPTYFSAVPTHEPGAELAAAGGETRPVVAAVRRVRRGTDARRCDPRVRAPLPRPHDRGIPPARKGPSRRRSTRCAAGTSREPSTCRSLGRRSRLPAAPASTSHKARSERS